LSRTKEGFPPYDEGESQETEAVSMSAYAKFYFRPAKGETIHTQLKPETEEGCGVCGTIADGEKKKEGALVLLFEARGQQTGKLLASCVTDEDGAFAFGPLAAGELYVVKVFCDSLKLRELEVIV
jgi:hypothetical protein